MSDPDPQANAPRILIPTNDLAGTESKYLALGYRVGNLYVGKFFPKLCQDHLYAVSFWKPAPKEQPELF